jgi:diguanylate cyclase (GGDEF)-like protein
LTAKKTEELDFSPFNAEDVLTALCKVLRTTKAISFSYAGDIQSLIDRIGRVFHAARCLMFVAAKNQSGVEIFEYVAESVPPVAHKFAGLHGQALALELMGLDDDINTLEDSEKFGGQLDGGYFLPLKIRGDAGSDSGGTERRAGLLCLQAGPNSRWNKLVLDIFVVIADHLARLAQIEQLSSSLADLESEDKVSGFLHRRFASEAVQKELARVNHFGDQATLILIDLDLGSRSPAVYGTSLGESVLKTTASVIVSNSRSVDIRGRLGLDEFLLFCPRVDEKEGMKLAEHLVKRINESLMNLTHKSDQKIETGVFVPTTASIGVAHRSQGADYETLFAAAQEALNAAQVSGGNTAKCLKALDNN